MKNLKKIVFGLLAMLVMVTSVSASKIDYDIKDVDQDAHTGFTTRFEQCTESTEDVVRCTVVEDGHNYGYSVDVYSKDEVLTIADGVKLTVNNIRVYKDAKLTIRVEGNGELTLSNSSITVDAGASLVIDYGKVTVAQASTPLIKVTGDTQATVTDPHSTAYTALSTSVVVNSGAILTSGWAGIQVVDGYADVTLNGDWKTNNGLIYVTGGNSDINVVGGKYVSAAEAILVNTGTTGTITVNGGTFTSTNGAVVNSGTLVVNNGTMDISTDAKTNTTHNALTIAGNANLTVNNGEFKADAEVLNFNSTGNLVIADGKFISLKPTAALDIPKHGEDSVITGGEYTGDSNTEARLKSTNILGKDLKAIRIGDTVYVGKEHKLDIEVVEENGKIVELHTPQNLLGGHTYTLKYLEDNRYLLVEANEGYVAKYVLVVGDEQTLVKDGEFEMPDSDAKLVVTFVTPDELDDEPAADKPVVDPGNDGEPAGDETEGKVPSTFDGIASIVTMAISSVSAAGYSIKKIIRK